MAMPKWVLYFGMPGLIALVAVTSGEFEQRSPALATLGSVVLRESDFRSYAKGVLAISHDPGERRKALEEYYDTQALAAKARRQGINRSPRFRKALELMETKILSHMLAERRSEATARTESIAEEELKTYYEAHKSEYPIEPRFTAYHLLVYVKGNPAFPDKGLDDTRARARAKKALMELRSGKSWEAVTRVYSDEITTNPSGLIRDGQFGHFAPEVEHAVKTQELGKPGMPIRSDFGYHVIEVEARVTESRPKPFEQVQGILTDRLQRERSTGVHERFMAPLREAARFTLRDGSKRDANLLDEHAVAPDELLAEVAGKPIRESDFRWFLDDAFIPQQRAAAFSRPGARASLLTSYLDMLVLEANARAIGLDETPEFVRTRSGSETDLLVEFLEARDNIGPFSKSAETDVQRMVEQQEYIARARIEVGLTVMNPRQDE